MKAHVFLLLLALAVLPVAAAERDEASLPWVISLHLIEMPQASAPIVCVPVGSCASAGEKGRASYAIGFLEKDEPSGCVVQVWNFQHHSVRRKEWDRCGIAPENVVRKLTAMEAAKLWCGWLDTDSSENNSAHTWDEFAQMTFLAAAMEQRGEHEAAAMLLQRARKEQRHGREHSVNPREFDVELKDELARGLLGSVEGAFGDLKIPHTALEPRLAEIVRHFPKSEAAAEAGPMLKFLRMVIEAEPQMAKDRLADDALAKLPVKERVACLIRLLPEQTGEQWSMPGSCDIFTHDQGVSRWRSFPPDAVAAKPKPATTPAGKLFQIGLDAVPQLIDAIDDRRPTRAVGIQKSSEQWSNVLVVGDCAFQILQRLSRRSFYAENMSSDTATARAQMKRNVEAWWKEASAGREAEMLDREISAGGEKQIVGNLIERLAQIAPERIFGAVERGLAHAGDFWNADSLLQTLSTVDSEPARALMRKTATEGRFLMARMTAARLINQSGGFPNGKRQPAYSADDRRAAREAMVREWKAFPASDARPDSYDGGELAKLLASMTANDASMYAAIAAEMPRHSANLRATFITSLSDRFPGEKYRPQPSEAPEMESYLAKQLEDVAFAPDAHFNKNAEVWNHGARVAEFAAHLMQRLWPERYAFTWDASAAEIEDARLACLNAWRATQKLPPLKPAAPLLAEADDPATVTSITLGKPSSPISPKLKPQVDAWLKKPLNAGALVRFLADFAKANENDTRSISLSATRSAARGGFAIELTIGARRVSAATSNSQFYVIADGRHLMGEIGGLELRLARKPDLYTYGEFRKHITEALAAPASAAVFIEAVRLARPAG